VRELGFGVLFGVSDVESALMAHRVLAFEERALRLMSDQSPNQSGAAEVLPFRRPASGDR